MDPASLHTQAFDTAALVKQAQRLEAEYRLVTEALHEAVYIVDQAGYITFANAALVHLTGYQHEELLDHLSTDLYPPHLRPLLVERRRQALQGEAIPAYVEAAILRKDGVCVPVELSTAHFVVEGQRLGRIVVLRDVTASKQAEEALHRAQAELEQRVHERTAALVQANAALQHEIDERRRAEHALARQAEQMHLLSTAVASSTDAILTKTLEGIMTSWNPAATQLYGFTAAEAIGQSIALIVPPDWQDELQTMLAQLRCGERIAPFETIRVHKDGTRIDVALTVSPITTPEGAVLGASAIARDMTAQKRLHEQLRHAQKMEAMGQLTGGLAHDFNNILGVILGNLDLLETTMGEHVVALQRIQAAQRATLRGADLTRRLLAFARRQPLNPEPTGVNALITELFALLPRILGPEIQITTQLAADVPLAQIDAAGLENALLNLAINARDAMLEGGTLTFATKCVVLDAAYPPVKAGEIGAGSYVWIAVSDTGHGMTREVLGQVFEPFFTTKPRDKGTGLGLAMVYGFVQQSNGHIRIYSEPEHGTSVHLYVPVAVGAAPLVRDTPVSPHTAPEQGTVLVVDDEVD